MLSMSHIKAVENFLRIQFIESDRKLTTDRTTQLNTIGE